MPGHAAHAAHPSAAKHLTEQVVKTAAAHAAEIHRGAATSTAAAEHVAHLLLLVEFSASLGGADGVVGGLNFLEFRLRTGVALVAVGVVLAGQLPERTLDFAVTGLTADTQDFVRVSFRHRP